MRKIAKYILPVYLLIYIFPLNFRPLVIPDETRYAEIGREMIQTGDWITPQLNALRYFEKPVLGYWLNALSIKIFGENSFAIRLPSALSVGLTAIMLILLIRRFTKNNTLMLLCGYVFLTCIVIFIIGTCCVLDSVFTMFVTVSIIALFFAFIEPVGLKKTLFFIASGIACGLAFLTKGFLAFLIPTIIIVPFAIWQRQWKDLIRFAGLTLTSAVLTALPWSIIIYIKEPDFWHYFFWVEHIDRFISPKSGQHPYPLWFFVPTALIGTLPWTFQIVDSVFKLMKDSLNNPLVRFCICWFLLPFIFFSISKGKLITYILPCFPPLIILFVLGFGKQDKNANAENLYRSNKTGIVIISLIIISMIVSQLYTNSLRIYRSNEMWKVIFLITGLSVYIGFLILANISKKYERRLAFTCLAPLLIILNSYFIVPDIFIENKAPIDFLSQYKDRIGQDTILISDNYMSPAVCWCYKRSDVFLFEIAGEFSYGIKYNESSKKRLIDINKLREWISKDLNKKHIVLITSTKRYNDYKQKISKPCFERIHGSFVFAEFGGEKQNNQ